MSDVGRRRGCLRDESQDRREPADTRSHPAESRRLATSTVALLVFRVLVSALQLTAFAPDEYFQGPEVAHRVVFGYGHLTWEWTAGLRSYVHPMLYAALYQIGSALGLGRSVTWWGPYLIHALITVWTDLQVLSLARLVFHNRQSEAGRQSPVSAVVSACVRMFSLNWFLGYCMARPYSNSLETALCTRALVGYLQTSVDGEHAAPTRDRPKHTAIWVLCGSLCVVLRPASGLFWAVLAVRAIIWPVGDPNHSSKKESTGCPTRERVTVFSIGVAVSGVVLAITTCLDWIMYGRLEVVPWNFLKFNVLDGGSALYGTSPWHANFTMHLPSMLLMDFPLFLYGWYMARPGRPEESGRNVSRMSPTARKVRFLAECSCLYCLIYSIAAHKEIRFLLPVLPMCMPVVAYGSVFLTPTPLAGKVVRILVHLIAFLFFSLVHQRGQVRVMSSIRELHGLRRLHGAGGRADGSATPPTVTTKVLFLTPCHATPYYASLHSPDIRMRFFDCSPEAYREQVYLANDEERSWMALPSLPEGMSERAYFELEPEKVLSEALEAGKPDVVVSFEDHVAAVEAHRGYRQWKSHWNSFSVGQRAIYVFDRIP